MLGELVCEDDGDKLELALCSALGEGDALMLPVRLHMGVSEDEVDDDVLGDECDETEAEMQLDALPTGVWETNGVNDA